MVVSYKYLLSNNVTMNCEEYELIFYNGYISQDYNQWKNYRQLRVIWFKNKYLQNTDYPV